MKKHLWSKITAIALCLALLTLSGCNKEKTAQEPETQAPEKIEVPHPLNIPNTSEYVYMDDISTWEEGVKRLGYDDAEVIYQTKDDKGYFVSVNADASNEDLVNLYAFYERENTVVLYIIGEGAYFDSYTVCEVDGNSETEEVAIHFGYIGSGAYHELQVWNFEYEMPIMLFTSECDFGYYSVTNEGYEVIIDNIYTDYQTVFNCKDNVGKEYVFDENGSPTSKYGADFGYEYETEIKDIDNDGNDELICKKPVYLAFRANRIGDVITTIDYDIDLKGFFVVDTEFVESTDGELV